MHYCIKPVLYIMSISLCPIFGSVTVSQSQLIKILLEPLLQKARLQSWIIPAIFET